MENQEIDAVQGEFQEDEQELFEHYRFVIDKGQDLLRIDKFLMNRIENATRTKIQQAAEAGFILVNGKQVKSNYRVKPLDLITIMLDKPRREIELVPEDLPIDIVYEDDSFLIVNKPPGIVVNPAYGNYRGTLMNALVYHFKQLPAPVKHADHEDPQARIRPGLVHRIDKNTSGLLVIAKSDTAMFKLAKAFFNHTIDRTYLALVWGDFADDYGTVNCNIGRSLKDRKKMDVFPNGDFGKTAITHFKVVERFGYVSLIECRLETGRTHQIRVHLKSIGHPIFNDDTYGGDQILKGTTFAKYKQFVQNCFDVIPRHALHARSLGFIHPETGEPIHFDSELPADFQAVLEKWRNYAQFSKDQLV